MGAHGRGARDRADPRSLRPRQSRARDRVFVTGRCEGAIERAATEINPHRAGYGGWRHLYLRTKQFNSDRSVAPYKTWVRGEIEAQGYTIIANVGDQWSDLENGYAERVFKLPNPFYMIP